MNEDRDLQTTEVRETRAVDGNTAVRRETVATTGHVGTATVAQRIIYYIAGLIIALLALRIVLLLLAANEGSPFVDFVYGLSGIFAWPFYGIFSYQPSYGHSTFELSSIVAIIVYALVAAGLAKLFTITSHRSET
jgi:hypothetical protein